MFDKIRRNATARALVLAITALLCVSPIASQSAKAQPSFPIVVEPALEIAGLYWGQSEAEAKRQLASLGYNIVQDFGGAPDFAEEVRTSVENRRNGSNLGDVQGTEEIEAEKGSEHIELTIKAIPQGSVVWTVKYSDESRSGRTLAAARAKYAPRPIRSYVFKTWAIFCQVRETVQCDHYVGYYDAEPTLPHIRASADALEILPGSKADAYYETAFNAAVAEQLNKSPLSF